MVHAGVLPDRTHGIVKVTILPRQPSFTGSTQNGMTSQSYSYSGPTDQPNALSYRIETVPGPVVLNAISTDPDLYGNIVKGDGPVDYWRLDETSGTLAKGSVGAHSGVYLNGVTLGLPGALPGTTNSVAFASSSLQKVDVAYSPALNPAIFTVELWAKLTGGSGYRSPLTSRGDLPASGYILYAEPDNTWHFWTGNGSWSNLRGPAVQNGAWTYLVGTYDGTNQHFYVNGVEASSALVGFTPNPKNPLRFGGGATEGNGDYFFDGNVDEVAVYNKALTAQQIANHYAVGIQRQTSPATISISNVNGKITIQFTGTLRSAIQATGPYTAVPGATNPFTVTPDVAARFYIAR